MRLASHEEDSSTPPNPDRGRMRGCEDVSQEQEKEKKEERKGTRKKNQGMFSSSCAGAEMLYVVNMLIGGKLNTTACSAYGISSL